MAARPLIAGNWKMNGLASAMGELEALIGGAPAGGPEILLCPPATLVAAFAARAAGTPVAVGAQDCHPEPAGAHTGDISAEMLADAGARWVIVGHSERRADHGETDALVAAKLAAAWRAGLGGILCVGESLAEREAGQAGAVVRSQLSGSLPGTGTGTGTGGGVAARLAVAYEPVWAIGTGRVAGAAEIAEMHAMLRSELQSRFGDAAEDVRLLYGGSVKPGNAGEILATANVDGALVGGASLAAADFLQIISGAP